MPTYSYRPALGGRREYGGHTPSWQGRAVRGGSRHGAGCRSSLAALDLANRPGAQGARYALCEVGEVGTSRRTGELPGRRG